MYDVIGIGATVYDTLILLDAFPAEDTKIQGRKTLVQGGGPCATALVAAAKLGVSVAYMGSVGGDSFGAFMLADFEKYGVSTEHINVVPDAASFHAVVLLSAETGSRTCIWSKGTAPPLTPGDLDESAIKSAKVLHLDGHMLDAAMYAAKIARKNGVKVSLDAGGNYPGIEALLPLVDFLISSEEFALKITGENDGEAAARKLCGEYRPEIFALTRGAKGGIIIENGELSRYPAFSVNVVDSNGAGDVFHGAFAAAYIKGMGFQDCAIYASAVSALKCTGFGARQSIPSDEQARKFIAERRGGHGIQSVHE